MKRKKMHLLVSLMIIFSLLGGINVKLDCQAKRYMNNESEIHQAVLLLETTLKTESNEIIQDILKEASTSMQLSKTLTIEEKCKIEQINNQLLKVKNNHKKIDIIEHNLENIEGCEDLANTLKKELVITSLNDFEKQILINPYTGKKLSTVREVKQYFENMGYAVDTSTYVMCKEIEKQKKKHKNVSIVELIEYINSALNKQSTKSNISISFGVVANASNKFTVTYKKWTKLSTQEKVLIATDPKKAVATEALSKKAFSLTAKKFGFNGLGDKSDGFRHAVWNALMARDISKTWAKSYSTAHESGKTKKELNQYASDGYKEKYHRKMDLHNNKIGRSVINWYDTIINVSDNKLQSRVSKKLTNNKKTGVYWLHN